MAVDYRKVPTRIIIEGDRSEGEKYYGLARKMLHELERNMQFQKLKQLSSFWKDSKATIECWHGFGLSQIRITTRGGAVRGKKKCFGCMCGCHVSMGIISVTEPESCITHITDLQQTYNVIVCQKKHRYEELTGCQPMDFTRYANKEKVYVLWVPDPPTTYADSPTAGCIMEASTWARILSIVPKNAKFDERPCH